MRSGALCMRLRSLPQMSALLRTALVDLDPRDGGSRRKILDLLVDLTGDGQRDYEVGDLDVLGLERSTKNGREFEGKDLPIAGPQASLGRCHGHARHPVPHLTPPHADPPLQRPPPAPPPPHLP